MTVYVIALYYTYSTKLSDRVIKKSCSFKNKCNLYLCKVPIFFSVLGLPTTSLKYVKDANE